MTDSWAAYLQPNETLLWEGAPLPGIRNWPRLVFLSLFGVPFLMFGLGGTGVALRHIFWLGEVGIGFLTLALGLAFLGVGYALVLGQWVEAATAHRRIRYALSTRFAYIARKARNRLLETYPILPQTVLEIEHGKGYDSIWFHVRSEKDSDSPGGLATSRIGFEGIADGAKVYQLMRGIQTGQT